MRIRIHRDIAKKVNAARKRNGPDGKLLSANQEVNKALAEHYAKAKEMKL